MAQEDRFPTGERPIAEQISGAFDILAPYYDDVEKTKHRAQEARAEHIRALEYILEDRLVRADGQLITHYRKTSHGPMLSLESFVQGHEIHVHRLTIPKTSLGSEGDRAIHLHLMSALGSILGETLVVSDLGSIEILDEPAE